MRNKTPFESKIDAYWEKHRPPAPETVPGEPMNQFQIELRGVSQTDDQMAARRIIAGKLESPQSPKVVGILARMSLQAAGLDLFPAKADAPKK